MKIQNAAEPGLEIYHKFIFTGSAGSGKSKLITTLPGRTFVWVFDPSALSAYQGCNWIDYSSYRLDLLDLTPYSLAKEVNKGVQKIGNPNPPSAYLDFAKDFNEAWNSGFYDAYDNVVLDSGTSFQDAGMDAVLYNNKRFGKVPWQDDYPAEMALSLRNYRSLTNLPKNVVLILHDNLKEDKLSGKVFFQTTLTGLNRAKVPNLFNHLLRCTSEHSKHARTGKTEARYLIQTTPDRFCPGVRTAFRGLEPLHDVTIPQDQFHVAQKYGLGKIIEDQKAL